MGDTIEPAMTEQEARRITDKIKDCLDSILSEAESIRLAVAEAHEGRAYKALGFTSWESYVQAEFGMTRGNAYRLVTQGKIIAAIEAAVPSESVARRATLSVSARQAKAIAKARDALPAITNAVSRGVEPARAVAEALAKPIPAPATKDRPRVERLIRDLVACRPSEAADAQRVVFDALLTWTTRARAARDAH